MAKEALSGLPEDDKEKFQGESEASVGRACGNHPQIESVTAGGATSNGF